MDVSGDEDFELLNGSPNACLDTVPESSLSPDSPSQNLNKPASLKVEKEDDEVLKTFEILRDECAFLKGVLYF